MVKDFTKVIIKHRNNSSNKFKKYLKPSLIDKLLASLPRGSAWEKRDYAMFMLMARMGLRPCETIRIRLSDIDWVNSQVFIRGKDKAEDWLPLDHEVGDAIIDYFKSSPRGESDFLFVKKRPPHSELLNTYPLMESLKRAYEETGIKPPTGSVRLNVFRHSFATKLVNSDGVSFHSVQAMMRHKNPEMTLYYAKYHSKKLSLFAKKWPEARK